LEEPEDQPGHSLTKKPSWYEVVMVKVKTFIPGFHNEGRGFLFL
jgi:hypothetical protein